jgi:anti-sigma-K factor RskA
MSTEIHALAGAYALDAVDDVERAAFRRHLAECETCALEVTELQETVGRLADSTWELPPPRLRDSVLAEVRRTRQATRGRADRDRTASAASAQRWRRWTAGTVAAGIIAVGVGVGTFAVQEQRVREAQTAAAEASRIQDVLSADDVVIRAVSEGGSELRVVRSESRNAAVVFVTGMAGVNADQAYQLWKIEGNNATSAGVLAAGRTTGLRYVEGIEGFGTIGVTRERAGGVDSPSTSPILAVTL